MTVLLQQEYAASGLLGVTELLGGPLCYTDRPHTKRGGNGSLWPITACRHRVDERVLHYPARPRNDRSQRRQLYGSSLKQRMTKPVHRALSVKCP